MVHEDLADVTRIATTDIEASDRRTFRHKRRQSAEDRGPGRNAGESEQKQFLPPVLVEVVATGIVLFVPHHSGGHIQSPQALANSVDHKTAVTFNSDRFLLSAHFACAFIPLMGIGAGGTAATAAFTIGSPVVILIPRLSTHFARTPVPRVSIGTRGATATATLTIARPAVALVFFVPRLPTVDAFARPPTMRPNHTSKFHLLFSLSVSAPSPGGRIRIPLATRARRQ